MTALKESLNNYYINGRYIRCKYVPVCKADIISLAVLVLLNRFPKRPWGRHCGAPSPADHVIKKMQIKIDSVSTAFIIWKKGQRYDNIEINSISVDSIVVKTVFQQTHLYLIYLPERKLKVWNNLLFFLSFILRVAYK